MVRTRRSAAAAAAAGPAGKGGAAPPREEDAAAMTHEALVLASGREAEPEVGLWQCLNAVMGLFFLLATVAQYNDPDPELFMPIYGLLAFCALREALGLFSWLSWAARRAGRGTWYGLAHRGLAVAAGVAGCVCAVAVAGVALGVGAALVAVAVPVGLILVLSGNLLLPLLALSALVLRYALVIYPVVSQDFGQIIVIEEGREFIGLLAAALWLAIIRFRLQHLAAVVMLAALATSAAYAIHLRTSNKSMSCPGPDHPTVANTTAP